MSPPPSPKQANTTVDLERDPLLPTSKEGESIVDMPAKGALNEDHLELRVGEQQSSRSSNGARILSRGLKGIAVLLIAFLAANGFWALFRPELYGYNGLISMHGKGDRHHYKHHHHHHHGPPPPPGPPGRGPHHPPGPPPSGPPGHGHPHSPPPPHGPPGHDHPHPPPPPHGPPGHDHPHPPPPPPHEPGHSHPHPPPPPPPHKPGHGPGGDRPGPPPPPPHHPHPPPPPPPHKGPGKVQDCYDLVPGKTLEIRAPLKRPDQGVEVAPSLAGSSVTFVWDGKVGPPAHPPRGPHPGPPRPPRPPHEMEYKDVEAKEKSPNKPKKDFGIVVFEIEVPAETEWKDANISSRELKLCSMLQPDSVGIHVFNASGIPPSHAPVKPAFDQIASSFNTTVYLPSHFARSPIRTGHLP